MPNKKSCQEYNQINSKTLLDYLNDNPISNKLNNDNNNVKTLEVDNIFSDPFLYFSVVNLIFFKNYIILNNKRGVKTLTSNFNIDDNNNNKVILPHPQIERTVFTIPYRSLVFNKNYGLTEKEISSYIGKPYTGDVSTTTLNCAARPPVSSVIIYGYGNNTNEKNKEILMCDCKDHIQLLNIEIIDDENITIKYIDGSTKLTFPLPGINQLISKPMTTKLESGAYHPIMGSTLINRPDNFLLDLNEPCSGLPDGDYMLTENDNNTSNLYNDTEIKTNQISQDEIYLFLNTHPNKAQKLLKKGQLNGTNIAPTKVKCTSGIISNIE
uniref:Wsv325-like protein n=1 Tax=Trachysalambria curvirostris majanivirus TaxID=2984281 RepID=A0A9C7F0Q9_9VIRU|nr:MAG: wsv325-like protein [Trachysalambria curvirostris majanivirus]